MEDNRKRITHKEADKFWSKLKLRYKQIALDYIQQELKKHIVYPATAKERITLTTASGLETAPFIIVESISIFKMPIRNVKVVCHDLPPVSRVDGLLGLSYLKNFKLTLNFKEGVLELE